MLPNIIKLNQSNIVRKGQFTTHTLTFSTFLWVFLLCIASRKRFEKCTTNPVVRNDIEKIVNSIRLRLFLYCKSCTKSISQYNKVPS